MSTRAVKLYVKTLINGLQPSTVPEPLVALTVPQAMNSTAPASPIAYVWAGNVKESRLAGSRQAGYKHRDYQLAIAVLWGLDTGSPTVDPDQMSDLCQAIVAVLRTAELNASITDAVSGESSYVELIGETFSTRYYPPVAADPQSTFLSFLASITTDVTERVKG